jgi:hypothetical protein
MVHDVYEAGGDLEEGHIVSGEGEDDVDWQAEHFEEGAGLPPRPIIRFTPLDGNEPPELTGRKGDEQEWDEEPDEASDDDLRGRFRQP